MKYIRWLYEITSEDLPLVGGKGANLGELARCEFPVPPGFCITTAAYREFVSHNHLESVIARMCRSARLDDPRSLEDASTAIRALFESGSLPPAVVDEVRAAHLELCDSVKSSERLALAVRSSATAEDLPDLSFAGQQDTYLNVIGLPDLKRNITRCFGSLWTARAIGYRAKNQIPQDDVLLAVVVQVMVPSEASGVLFTANPLSGRRSEMVIDATLGLGEALVSGQVEPDHFVVDPHRGVITQRRLGAKALSIRPISSGGVQRMDESGSGAQALEDRWLLELADLGLRAETHFGQPQDIEWALAGERMWVVQSRPITSLYPLPAGMNPSGDTVAMMSLASVQGMMNPYTPLGADVLRCLVAGIASKMDRPLDEDTQYTLLTAGERLYINITGLVRSPVFRRFLNRFFQNIEPALQSVIPQLLAHPGLRPAKMRFTFKGLATAFSFLWPLGSSVLYNLINPARGRMRLNRGVDAALAWVGTAVADAETLQEQANSLSRSFRDMPDLFLRYLVPAVASGQVGIQLLMNLVGDTPEGYALVLELARGLPHNVTTEMDLALWDVAQVIAGDDASRAMFITQEPQNLAQAWLAGSLPTTAQQALNGFMKRYGMRGVGEIDMGRRRWREEPTPLMQVVCSYMKIEDESLSPRAIFENGAAHSSVALEKLQAYLRRKPGGWIQVRFAGWAAHRLRELGGLRESPKFLAIRCMGMWREALLASGERLVEQARLNRADDIFFLRMKELARFDDDQTTDWRALVRQRRQVYVREMSRRQVPRLILSDGTTWYEGVQTAHIDDERHLNGSPVSPGKVEGVVRVVLDPRNAQLLPGEILVCPATDPGWTPLFLAAAGLVMEVGGMMTHGSVVAREYGIPAVVGVAQVTRKLKTGQRVRVDGSLGLVEVLEDAMVNQPAG